MSIIYPKPLHIRIKNLSLLLSTLILPVLYIVLNHPATTIHSLATSLDTAIPLIPAFAVPYLLIIPFFWVVILYAYFKDKRFEAFAVSTVLTYGISLIIYHVFQTEVVRAAVTGHDVFSTLVAYIYAADRPYNAFPSLHVSSAVLMTVYVYAVKDKAAAFYLLFGVIVILSTLFIKQHYIADVLGGLALGLLSSWIGYRYFA